MKQDIHCKEKLPEVTGEYLYYKGIIRGLEEAKKSEKYKYVETMDNENTNGNALFMIVQEWLNG